MSSIVISSLDYAPPGLDSLFFDISFGVGPGEHAAIVGANGVGKSTILRILTGEVDADGGEFSIGGLTLGKVHRVTSLFEALETSFHQEFEKFIDLPVGSGCSCCLSECHAHIVVDHVFDPVDCRVCATNWRSTLGGTRRACQRFARRRRPRSFRRSS